MDYDTKLALALSRIERLERLLDEFIDEINSRSRDPLVFKRWDEIRSDLYKLDIERGAK